MAVSIHTPIGNINTVSRNINPIHPVAVSKPLKSGTYIYAQYMGVYGRNNFNSYAQ